MRALRIMMADFAYYLLQIGGKVFGARETERETTGWLEKGMALLLHLAKEKRCNS